MSWDLQDDHITVHASGESVASSQLLELEWLAHASTTRRFSAAGSTQLQDLMKAQGHLGLHDSILIHGEQKHTSNVGIVTDGVLADAADKFYYRFPATDALVCPFAGVTLGIMTADCAPIFLVDPVRRIIGLTHAGWRGTIARIVGETVRCMHELGSSAEDLIAWIGPMAGGCCYEVGPDLVEDFRSKFPNCNITSVGNPRCLDLVGINAYQLKEAGLRNNNILTSNLCTIHNSDHFFSYRADAGTTGRIISVIGMRG